MDTLSILKYPDERLHLPCKDVTVFDKDLQDFGQALLRTMKASKGIGLAAPQVGIQKNIIAVCIEKSENSYPFVFVNPKITEVSEELYDFREGCLSVPGYYEDRKRPKRITVEFHDVYGVRQTTEFFDLHAFCIQHEIDHLNGRVFIDDLSELKKDRIKTKIRKLIK